MATISIYDVYLQLTIRYLCPWKYVSLRYRAIVGCSINLTIIESCGANNEYDLLHPLKFSWILLRFLITKSGCVRFIFICTKRSANILSKRQKIYIKEDVSKLLKRQVIHLCKPHVDTFLYIHWWTTGTKLAFSIVLATARRQNIRMHEEIFGSAKYKRGRHRRVHYSRGIIHTKIKIVLRNMCTPRVMYWHFSKAVDLRLGSDFGEMVVILS